MRTDFPDLPATADEAASRKAAYVHIPFCRRVCPYCDFAVVAGTEMADRYVDAVCSEIAAAQPFSTPLGSVAFGGGTPSALPPQVLGRILDAIGDRLGLAPDAEVSLEANPEDISRKTAEGLRAAGFGRISLGVQSFDDAVLASLGRAHTAAEAGEAVAVTRDVFASLNVDLIFGTPGESIESWVGSVRRALDLGVDHLSTYSLTVERGTPLSRAVAAGAPAPDQDLQADQWLTAAAMARDAGLVRYETSNHARPGHAVLYNLITWGQGEYAAFGSGAHRHRAGVRSWNVRRLDRYMERIERGESATSGEEVLDPWAKEVERVMLGLRRVAGVEPDQVGTMLLESPSGAQLVQAGVLSLRDGRLRIDRPLLSDEVSRSLLALAAPDC